MRYLVMLRRTDTGYCADVPDLPGCVAAGKSLKGTLRLIAEAIGLHIDLMKQSGETVPTPRRQIKFVIDDSVQEEFCTWVDAVVPASMKSE